MDYCQKFHGPPLYDKHPSSSSSNISSDSSLILTPTHSPVASLESSNLSSSLDSESVMSPKITSLPGLPFPLPTFKLFGDNVDKTVRPRIETSEHHTQCLHYFQGYAFKDRFDTSKLDDSSCVPDFAHIKVEKVLPTLEDQSTLKKNMSILAALVIQNIFLSSESILNLIQKHMPCT